MIRTIARSWWAFLCLSILIPNNIQAQAEDKTTFFVSPSLGFIPSGINSLEGLSLGMILPWRDDLDIYFEMMGMGTLSTGLEDAYEFEDWHQSSFWGLELGAQRYFKIDRIDPDRNFQFSSGLMFRSGSEEFLSRLSDNPNQGRQLRSHQLENGELLFTKYEKLNDLGLSLGLAYEIPFWEGIASYGGGKVYLSPSGNHFARFTFQIFYDL